MNTSWSLRELRELVTDGTERSELILEIIGSVDRSITILSYHVDTARHSMDGLIDEEEPIGRANFERLAGIASDAADFHYAQMLNEAHTLAAIYILRSVYDIFAQLLNVVVLDGEVEEEKCNIYRIANRLPASDLKLELQKVMSSMWFKYVAAFTNTIKHRRLVDHGFTIDFLSRTAEVRFKGFKYKGEVFQPYSSTVVLEGLLAVKNAIVSIGVELNRTVRNAA